MRILGIIGNSLVCYIDSTRTLIFSTLTFSEDKNHILEHTDMRVFKDYDELEEYWQI